MPPKKTPIPPPSKPAVGRTPESDKVKTQRATVDALAAKYDAMVVSTKRDAVAFAELGAQLTAERNKLAALLK